MYPYKKDFATNWTPSPGPEWPEERSSAMQREEFINDLEDQMDFLRGYIRDEVVQVEANIRHDLAIEAEKVIFQKSDEALKAMDYEFAAYKRKIEAMQLLFTDRLEDVNNQLAKAQQELKVITEAIEERKKALREGRWAKIECDSDFA